MTRFARAKGSKSSNEKVPEEATPWSEMRKGMLGKHEKPNESTKKCIAMLKAANNKKQIVWSALETDNDDSLNILKKHLKAQKEQKKLKAEEKESHLVSERQNRKAEKRKKCETENVVKKKKKIENIVSDENVLKKIKSERKKNIRNKKVEKSAVTLEGCREKNENEKHFEKEDLSNAVKAENTEISLKALKKKKKKKLKVLQSVDSKKNDSTVDMCEGKKISRDGEAEYLKTKEEKFVGTPEKLDKNLKSIKKKKNVKGKVKKKMKNFAAGKSIKNDPMTNVSEDNNVTFMGSRNYNNRNKREDKFRTSINIGGEIVNLVKFQGYFIKTEDATRLKDLKRQLKKEGIPAEQIESVIRLERRKCEKSLARMKKNVCFQCRKPGHILSQCPEVTISVDTSIGICYKCGSTEHKAFTCKVNQKEKYPFAECFICKEKGHIARECPDNPKGLYPKGGCCKLCGDVTHLKKDCPKRIAEIEENTLTLKLQDDRNVEALEDEGCKVDENANKKKKKKKAVVF